MTLESKSERLPGIELRSLGQYSAALEHLKECQGPDTVLGAWAMMLLSIGCTRPNQQGSGQGPLVRLLPSI